jgi:hypothetical protein
MTVVAKSDRYTSYTLASDQAGPFLVGFPLFDTDRLQVWVNEVLRSDYTISADFADGFDNDASITFSTSLVSADEIEILGDMRADKEREVLAGEGDATAAMQLQITRLTAMMQEVQRDMRRAVKRNHTGTDTPTIYPDEAYDLALVLKADGTLDVVPVISDALDTTQLTATVACFFDSAPQNGHDRPITNPYTLTIYETGISATTYGDAPGVAQEYSIRDNNTEFATATFNTDGSATVSMPEPFHVTSTSVLRIIAPGSVSNQHTKFDITIKGTIS